MQFFVSGMHCAACSTRVEKAVRAVKGVETASVNLLTGELFAEGGQEADILLAVENAGYAAVPAQKGKTAVPARPKDGKKAQGRLIVSVVLLVILMYVSMGHMISLPLPRFLADFPLGAAALQFVLSFSVLLIHRRFFTNGISALFRKAPNMDTLVSLGSGASFIYSTALLIQMTGGQTPHALLHNLYFDSAAMILVLITVGKLLEERAKGKTTDALSALSRLAPKTALVLRDGVETEIPAEEIVPDDIFLVKSGSAIGADGIVLSGHGSINEAAMTGESLPAEKAEGDTVSAGTTCLTGFLTCRATATGEDTTLSQMIRLVSDAASSKAPIARLADKVSGIFVPCVMGISLITAAVWLLMGQSIGFALTKAISVLVISCPCALGLATPVAIMVGSGIGAKHGVLFKTAAALEMAGRITTVAFDKTGTVTSGTPSVSHIVPMEGISEEELVLAAVSLEAKSEHPLGKAIVKKADEIGILPQETESFTPHPGGGISAVIDGVPAVCGNARFLSQRMEIPKALQDAAETYASMGETPVYFASDAKVLGLITLKDTVKEDSREAISALHKMGIDTVMLTGDIEKTAQAVAREVGIKHVYSGVRPDEKEEKIRSLCESGKTAMVGDGINDAPALTSADMGIAIGAGTQVAIDAADAVLINSRLSDVVLAIRLGRRTLKTIRENLFWAFIYNTLGIPIAAGVFSGFGITLRPMLGALFMSMSSLCVVTNALRLYSFPSKKHKKERTKMEIVMKIEGMMCPHCEKRVKELLEAIPGVETALCSHEAGTATLTLSQKVDDAILRETVENAGYHVL